MTMNAAPPVALAASIPLAAPASAAPPPTVDTVAAPIAAAVARAAGVAETDARQLGLDPVLLGDPIGRVPLARYYELWESAVRRTRDPALALSAALDAPAEALPLLGFACATQPNLGAALAALAELGALWSSGEPFVYERGVLPTLLLHQPESPSAGRDHAALFAAAKVIADARAMTGDPELVPLLLRLRRLPGGDTAAAEALLGCPIACGCTSVELVWRQESVARPLLRADASLAAYFADQARAAIAELTPGDRYLERVARAIREGLERGDASMTRVAEAMSCSPRTLRRQLARRGSGFRELLDEIRCELACRYLRRSELSLAEVTERLAFSEQSNFQRAFKRWTETTPDRFRRGRARC